MSKKAIIPKCDDAEKLNDTTHPYPTGKQFYDLMKLGLGSILDTMPATDPVNTKLIKKAAGKRVSKKPVSSDRYFVLDTDVGLWSVAHTYIVLDIENLNQQAVEGFLCDHDIDISKGFLNGKAMQTLKFKNVRDKHANKARKAVYNWIRDDPVGLHPNIAKNNGEWHTLR